MIGVEVILNGYGLNPKYENVQDIIVTIDGLSFSVLKLLAKVALK